MHAFHAAGPHAQVAELRKWLKAQPISRRPMVKFSAQVGDNRDSILLHPSGLKLGDVVVAF